MAENKTKDEGEPTEVDPAHLLIGELMKRLRKRIGYAQKTAGLASKVGGQSTINRIEKGFRELNLLEFVALCRTYEVEASTIIQEVEAIEAGEITADSSWRFHRKQPGDKK